MASTWGSSWGTSWGSSWGATTGATELVGRRIRRRRRIGWRDPEFVKQQIVTPPAPLNLEEDKAAWAAISERINRISALRTQLETAQVRTKSIQALERELAFLEAEEAEEDDVEIMLLPS